MKTPLNPPLEASARTTNTTTAQRTPSPILDELHALNRNIYNLTEAIEAIEVKTEDITTPEGYEPESDEPSRATSQPSWDHLSPVALRIAMLSVKIRDLTQQITNLTERLQS